MDINVKYYFMCRLKTSENFLKILSELDKLFDKIPNVEELNEWKNEYLSSKTKSMLLVYQKLENNKIYHKLRFSLEPGLHKQRAQFYALCRYQLDTQPAKILTELRIIFGYNVPTYGILNSWIRTNFDSKINSESSHTEAQQFNNQIKFEFDSISNENEKLVRSLTKENHDLSNHTSNLEIELNKVNDLLKKTQSNFDLFKTETEIKLKKTIDDSETKIKNLNLKINEANVLINNLQMKVVNKSHSNESIKSEPSDYHKENFYLEQKLNHAYKMLEDKEEELTKLKQESICNYTGLSDFAYSLKQNETLVEPTAKKIKSNHLDFNGQLNIIKTMFNNCLKTKEILIKKIISLQNEIKEHINHKQEAENLPKQSSEKRHLKLNLETKENSSINIINVNFIKYFFKKRFFKVIKKNMIQCKEKDINNLCYACSILLYSKFFLVIFLYF